MATTTDLGKWMITNGGDYDPEKTYEQLTMVMYDSSTYITLKQVTGVTPADDKLNYILMARGFNAAALNAVTATDTSGALGEEGASVNAQSLVDYLADAVMTKLLKKTDIATVLADATDKVPALSLVNELNNAITQLKGNMLQLDTLDYSVECTSQSSSVLGGYYGSKRLDSNENYTASKKYMVISCYNSGNGTIIGCATIQGVNIRVAAAGSGTYSCVLLALGNTK